MARFPASPRTKLDTVVKLEDPDASCMSTGACGLTADCDTSPAITVVDATEAGLGDWVPNQSDLSVINGL